VRIEEVHRTRDLVVNSLDADYRLRPTAPANYLDNGVRPCYRLTTHTGREIEVTSNHPFLTMAGWKPLSQLKVGDSIAVPRSLPVFGQTCISDAHVIVLGHLIAEGCLTRNVPYFSNTNPEMKQDFSDAVRKAFPGMHAHWYPDGRWCSVSGGRRGPKAKNPCTAWLRELGLMGTDSATKFIPDFVFTLPRRQMALFLNRLFSGDGHLQQRRSTGQVIIEYCSNSKRLADDVRHLLLRLGLVARLVRHCRGHYRVILQGSSQCLRFLRGIGFLHRRDAEPVAASLAEKEGVGNPNLDLIPCAVWSRIEQAAVAAGYANATALVKATRGDRYRGGAPRRNQAISRERLLRLATKANARELARLARSDIYWDRIACVEPAGEHRVYDLSIAETHNFVANDIIIHNSWLSEHLAAAISGTSILTIQGTAGTTEEHIKYSWNIARVIAEGPRPDNLIPSPTMVAMRTGGLLRFEELTRCVPDVQDALVSILSDKAIAVPELPDNNMVWARPGFNVIATANTRDQGVNELSAALKRRFNYIYIPIVGDQKTEVKIVQQRSAELLERYRLPAKLSPPVIELLATVFREIRSGKTADGVSLKKPTTTLSTAEAIGVALDAALHAQFFGGGDVGPADIARNMVGVVVKEDQDDRDSLKEYAALVAKKRGVKEKAWKEFHDALVEQL
jgi:intein/homing endonuclease